MKQIRKLDILTEIRADESEGRRTLRGLIPYNSKSIEMWGEFEVIKPTAFNKTLSDGSNVLALVAHDETKILGSTRSGTLRLTNRDDGLFVEVDLPDTDYAQAAWEIIRRGDVTAMSFGFKPVKTRQGWDPEVQKQVSYLEEVRLLEVSFMVAFPAYPETASVARSIAGLDLTALADALEAENPNEEQIGLIRKAKEIIHKRLEPPQESTTEAARSTSAGDFWEALVEAARKL